METLTLEEKVGQVFIFGFLGKEPKPAYDLIAALKPGGFIYFARNCGTVKQTSALSAQLQEHAKSAGSVPLFIAVDQEGGKVSRLTQDTWILPGPMSLSAATLDNDHGFIKAAARATALQLRSAGINMNLAPVLDVNNNPRNPVIGTRSFGEDPHLVAMCGGLVAEGFKMSGIIAVGKHFPGHGNTWVDPHLELPSLPHSANALDSCELIPFRFVINREIPAIMSAHIVFERIDRQHPATLSAPVLQQLLRRALGFQGLIITDCLEMKAISQHFGTAKGALMAFKAGCDLLLISHTRKLQEQAFVGLLNAVKSGQVSENRLNASIKRILKAKKTYGIPNALPPERASEPRLERLSHCLHKRSITLVKNEKSLVPLPLDHKSKYKVFIVAFEQRGHVGVEKAPFEGSRDSSSDQRFRAKRALGESLYKLSRALEIHEPSQVGSESLESSVHACKNADFLIILSENARQNPYQRKLIKTLVKIIPNTLFVAVKDPYDLEIAPKAHTCLCTYSNLPESMAALALVLLGKHTASGKLPVSIPDFDSLE